MKHIKSYKDFMTEREKVQKENIAFWAGSQSESPSGEDDPEIEKLRGMFRDKQISTMTRYGRKQSYI
jgi:hypothetical protein